MEGAQDIFSFFAWGFKRIVEKHSYILAQFSAQELLKIHINTFRSDSCVCSLAICVKVLWILAMFD